MKKLPKIVVSFRLEPLKLGELKKIAKKQGVAPTVFIRGLISERINGQNTAK